MSDREHAETVPSTKGMLELAKKVGGTSKCHSAAGNQNILSSEIPPVPHLFILLTVTAAKIHARAGRPDAARSRLLRHWDCLDGLSVHFIQASSFAHTAYLLVSMLFRIFALLTSSQ